MTKVICLLGFTRSYSRGHDMCIYLMAYKLPLVWISPRSPNPLLYLWPCAILTVFTVACAMYLLLEVVCLCVAPVMPHSNTQQSFASLLAAPCNFAIWGFLLNADFSCALKRSWGFWAVRCDLCYTCRFDLGEIPPTITSVQVSRTPRTDRHGRPQEMLMEMNFEWKGDQEMELIVKPLPRKLGPATLVLQGLSTFVKLRVRPHDV